MTFLLGLDSHGPRMTYSSVWPFFTFFRCARVPNEMLSVLTSFSLKICACWTSSFRREAVTFSISCFSSAALYSAFSRRSPFAMATPISLEFSGISTSITRLRSCCFFSKLARVTRRPRLTFSTPGSPRKWKSGILLLDPVLELDLQGRVQLLHVVHEGVQARDGVPVRGHEELQQPAPPRRGTPGSGGWSCDWRLRSACWRCRGR